MLQLLHLRRFGAIGSTDLDLAIARVTVLVGANGTGKSSVLRGLGVLAQTAERRDRIGLVHDGARARFERAEHMHYGLQLATPLELGVDLAISEERVVDLAEQGQRLLFPFPTDVVSYRCTSSEDRGVSRVAQSLRFADHVAEAVLGPSGPELRSDGVPGRAHAPPDRVLDPNVFLAQGGFDPNLHALATAVRGFLARRVRTIATVRSVERFSLETTTRASDDTGPNGAFTLQFMQEETLRAPKRGRLLDTWLERLGLHGFRVGVVAGRFAPRFDDQASKATLPLYLAAQGHQQILELVAQLAFAEPGTVITAEEPENGLHPAAQVELADIIAEASSERDLQVILSTQSPTFALAFCRAVRRGKLKADELALHELTRGREGTVAQRLTVDAEGMTHPAWFSSFANAEAELIREFLPPEKKSDAPPPEAKRVDAKSKAAGSARRRR